MSPVDVFPIVFVGGVFTVLIGKLVFNYVNENKYDSQIE